MKHENADVLIAMANGEEVEYLDGNVWVTYDPKLFNNRRERRFHILASVLHDWGVTVPWRVKPKTIRIGDMEVPKPCPVAPAHGTAYFVPNILCTGARAVHQSYWCSNEMDEKRLKRGIVHLTEEAALAHAKALVAISGGEVPEDK